MNATSVHILSPDNSNPIYVTAYDKNKVQTLRNWDSFERRRLIQYVVGPEFGCFLSLQKKRELLFPRNASSNKSRITLLVMQKRAEVRKFSQFHCVESWGGGRGMTAVMLLTLPAEGCRSVRMPDMLFLEHILKCFTVFCVMWSEKIEAHLCGG